jgi:hypothetical protein
MIVKTLTHFNTRLTFISWSLKRPLSMSLSNQYQTCILERRKKERNRESITARKLEEVEKIRSKRRIKLSVTFTKCSLRVK